MRFRMIFLAIKTDIPSERRRPVIRTSNGRISSLAGRSIRRIRKRDRVTLPMQACLVKRQAIQCEPRMAIEMCQVFPHATLKPHRISQSPGEPIESQRPWEAIPFPVIGKQCQPAIHVVGHIPHHRVVRPPRHRVWSDSIQYQRQTLASQQEANPQHHQAYAQQGPILFHDPGHSGFQGADYKILNHRAQPND